MRRGIFSWTGYGFVACFLLLFIAVPVG